MMSTSPRVAASVLSRAVRESRVVAARRVVPSQRHFSGKVNPTHAKTTAGTGRGADASQHEFSRNRGPVSWPALGLVAVAAASAVAYYQIERERRLEKAMGKIVSSESDGWSPNPEFLGKRQWKLTKWGWFPAEDAFGGGESIIIFFEREKKKS